MNTVPFRAALFAVLALTAACSQNADADDADVSLDTTASAQTKEHILLARQVQTHNMATIAGAMGTRDGRLVVVDASGAQRSLAVNGATYVAGAAVYTDARAELCEESRAGLTSCTALASSGSSSGFECDDDLCECNGLLDCMKLAFTGWCVEGTVDCNENSCICDQ